MAKKPTYKELEQSVKKLEEEISKYKDIKEVLGESEEKYRKLFEEARDGIVLTEAETGIIIDCNPETAKLVERKKSELLGQHQRILHPQHTIVDGFSDTFIKHRDKFNGQILDAQIITSTGEIKDVAIKCNIFYLGNKKCLQGIFRDITEQKLAKEALRESDKKYRTLFEDSRDAIYITRREGEFVDVNQSALDLFGYTKEEMVGLDARKIYVDPIDRSRFQQKIEANGFVRDYEIKFCKKNGTEMDCLLTATVRYANDRSVSGYQGIIRDMTEAKRIEAQLLQAQKMEAIGALSGGIAHDFNNLLMGILGHVSLLLLHTDPNHPHFERLKGIEDIVQKGANLTKQLLGFARGGKYEVRPTDLNELIMQSSEMFSRTQKNIEINTKYQKDIWRVEVDQGQIEQVLLNLYVNAWQAMPDGGYIYIETSNVKLDKIYSKAFGVKPGNYVWISVSDTGIGIDDTTRQRIFEPFFTTKEMSRGTGLGLASAYGIIKNHGGIINVYSEKGKGATFNIYLPASEEEISITKKRAADEITKGTETILLVDDEDIIIDVGRDMLKEIGYKVLVARSGKEAIEAYRKHKDIIDLVIVDMVMPHMDGGKVYDRMKEINLDVRVILSSGYSLESQAKDILDRGCNGFIQKPFNINDLSQKIREILEKK